MHLKHFSLSWENAFVLEVYNVVQARHGLWYCEDLAVHALWVSSSVPEVFVDNK